MSADFALTRNFKLSDAATTKCMLFCFGLWVKNIENIYPTSCISHISTNYPPGPRSNEKGEHLQVRFGKLAAKRRDQKINSLRSARNFRDIHIGIY